MRLSLIVFIMTFFMAQVGASSFAQELTYTKQNASLKEVFDEITKQTGFYVLYQSSKVHDAQRMNVNFKKKPLHEVLNQILAAQNLTYIRKDKNIVISPKQVPGNATEKNTADPVTIQGKVTDFSGNPIPGVTVKVKGTNLMKSTDSKGEYAIEVPKPGEILVFSFIGYKIKEEKVGNKTTLNVKLEQSVSELSSVVVTGLYSRPTENFTGAATTIKGADLRTVNAMNVFDAIKVFDPAIRVPDNMEFGSDPNRLPKISLRGTNNFPGQAIGENGEIPSSGADFMAAYQSNPSMPLFMLDGFEVSLQKIYDLDITRIEKITILKDAVATSAYGARAANGVIVVETKQPQAGKLTINYSSTLQLTSPDLSSYHLLNAKDKLELERVGGLYFSSIPQAQTVLDQRYANRRAEIARGVDTYWLSQPLQTGIGTRQGLYVEGGDQFVRYGINFGYGNNKGVMKGSGRQTYDGGMSLSYRKNKFMVRNQLSVSANKSDNSPYGSFGDYSRLNPYWNPYDAKGNIKKSLEDIVDPGYNTTSQIGNPLYNANLGTVSNSKYSGISNNTFLEWRFDGGLRLTGKFGFSSQNDESNNFLPADHTSFSRISDYNSDDYTSRGSYAKNNSTFFNYDGSLTADYNKTFGKHVVYATIGASAAQQHSESTGILVRGFPNNRLDEVFFGKEFQKGSRPSGQDNLTRRISSFASFNYTFDKRFLFDLALNVDGSTQFGEMNRFAPFWAIGLGWNLHEEAFMARLKPVLNRLKLRGGIGTTGSQQFSPFMAITTYTYNTGQDYLGMYGANLMSYGNPNLKWQQTNKTNLGADVSLFQDRLQLRLDAYFERTDNLLLDISTPPSLGLSSYKENMGKLGNTGIEGSLTAFLIKPNANSLSWSMFVNGINNKNKILRISNSLKKMNEQNDAMADKNKQTRPLPRYQEGQSVNAIWAVRSAGIDPSTGMEVYYDRDGKLTYIWNPVDKVVVGDELPKLSGNLGTNLTYKGFQFGAYFSYQLGAKQYNNTLANSVENADISLNVDERVFLERWKQPGDVTFFKGLTTLEGKPVTSKTNVTSRFMQKNNYLNFTSISFGYILPDKISSKWNLKNTRFGLQANNILQLSTIRIERGLSYPFARNFTFSLNTTF
ncbi:SusC/RagA family TonB-linked outer membrane protein [Pedobacter gandavensis]|uniref:SusC/RagA family TonB-linked outer membrane protein n=1 Tax=Pedobacter gandavensis TaxID=2679963 RepID=UPI002931E193|nr:SusC/RagA family TonB-linked outer membrane protein [Pedobacter gandavensis]